MRPCPGRRDEWLELYDNHRFVSSSEVRRAGLSPEWLSWAARVGEIVKIVPGLYRRTDQPWDRMARLELIGRILPRATISMTTALTLHAVTDADESEPLWLWFDTKAYVPNLAGLGARAVKSSTPAALGEVRYRSVGQAELRVHSTARAVVECFRFRQHLGDRAAMDAMEAALDVFACHPQELKEIARRCRVERVVRSHLAAWSRRAGRTDNDELDGEDEPAIPKTPGRPPHRRDPLPLVGELAWANGTLPQTIADRAILPPRRRSRPPPEDSE